LGGDQNCDARTVDKGKPGAIENELLWPSFKQWFEHLDQVRCGAKVKLANQGHNGGAVEAYESG
jgi:hypothetical protein